MAFARGLVQTLLDSGDVAGALNLMIACRGLIEQAHAQAITDNLLLGPHAMRRLGNSIIDIIADSLRHVYDLDPDQHFEILDKGSEKLKSMDAFQ